MSKKETTMKTGLYILSDDESSYEINPNIDKIRKLEGENRELSIDKEKIEKKIRKCETKKNRLLEKEAITMSENKMIKIKEKIEEIDERIGYLNDELIEIESTSEFNNKQIAKLSKSN